MQSKRGFHGILKSRGRSGLLCDHIRGDDAASCYQLALQHQVVGCCYGVVLVRTYVFPCLFLVDVHSF